ncbi:MAG: hypothetical protein NT023_17945 [Armatimonadetes bacterium]|nr:hypothetical protein [Armatimonadota bacterium]
MRRSLFPVLLMLGLLLGLMGNASIASAAIPRTLTFLCENCDIEMFLSSGSAANSMPMMYASVTAQYSIGADPAPNLTLNFYVTDLNNAPSNLVQIDRVSDITNSDGKCRVIINGPGASVTDNTILLVHLKRVDPVSGQTVISASVKVHLRQYNTTTYDSPFVSSAISPGTGISYHDNLLTKMASYASQSLSDWTVANRVTFTRNLSSYKLIFQEIDAGTDTWWGQTLIPDTPNPWRKIQYNMYPLDSDWVTPHRAWAPLGWRHYIQSMCDHEVGHFLGLGHNTVFDKSLMAIDDPKYFVWGTVVPRTQDWNPILAHYP